MNRFSVYIPVFFLAFVIPATFASANCFVTGTIPGQGNIVVCDGNPPNPDPSGVQVGTESTNDNDEITIEAGASINTGGFAVSAGQGADLVVVNPGAGNLTGGGSSLATDGSGNTFIVRGGNLTAGNGIFFNGGDNNSVEFSNATINAGNNGMFFGAGSNNSVMVSSGNIIAGNNGIALLTGNNNAVEISKASITAGNNGVFFNDGNNKSLIFNSGTINAVNTGIFMNFGNNTIHINGGTITPQFGRAIETQDGEDLIVLRGGRIDPNMAGETIFTGPGNDTVRIVRLDSFSGLIDGEEGEADTLIFAQVIPNTEQCNTLRGQIAALNPSGDSITINGISFTWVNFEIIEDQLTCLNPIPTLSEWGLIGLAGVLGLIGFMAIRRKKITA